jgi:large subunit ribosomal protein L24
MQKFRKDDNVVVTTGRDKGKSGKILRVLTDENRLVVQGVNIAKRHARARPGDPGGITEKELAIHASNVAHLDPKDNKPTRVGFRVVDGKKLRVAKRSGEIIDR